MSSEEKKEREFLDLCRREFDSYKHEVFRCRTSEDVEAFTNEFYKNLKHLAYFYYRREKIPDNYRYLAQDMYLFEKMLPIDSIFEYPRHDFSKVLDRPSSLGDTALVLDYIVDQTRNYLFDKVAFNRDMLSFENYDLLNECMDATDFAHNIASRMGIPCREITIYQNFRRSNSWRQSGVHSILLVLLNGQSYLVDCTYNQFCSKYRCNLNRLGVPLLVGPAPGAFMQMSKKRQEVAKDLLTRGWVECSLEIVKAYFDGFLLSFRNGLYYERTNDFSFEVLYTAECYEDFIFGMDNLFNYEREDELGFQLKPLDNPNMLIRCKN